MPVVPSPAPVDFFSLPPSPSPGGEGGGIQSARYRPQRGGGGEDARMSRASLEVLPGSGGGGLPRRCPSRHLWASVFGSSSALSFTALAKSGGATARDVAPLGRRPGAEAGGAGRDEEEGERERRWQPQRRQVAAW